jgi:hypothetical protein
VENITGSAPVLSTPLLEDIPDFQPNVITVIPAADVGLATITQNHVLSANNIASGSPTSNVFMAFVGAHPQVPLETYTNVSVNITEVWAELSGGDVITIDPWTKDVA